MKKETVAYVGGFVAGLATIYIAYKLGKKMGNKEAMDFSEDFMRATIGTSADKGETSRQLFDKLYK